MGDRDLSGAFGSLDDRSDADPHDRISLRDHVVLADVGAFEEERGKPQRLRFAIVAEVGRDPDRGDDVDRILSYDALADAVAAELKAGRADLLETLADGVAARVLGHPQVRRVFVRIEKLDRGPGDLGVEIARTADSLTRVQLHADRRSCIVVVLGKDAAASPGLWGMLDALERSGASAVLCAPIPDAPRADTPEAQERIDLLAADQGAWLLAARDERLAVAASRTELDWLRSERRMAVWAPFRLSLERRWPARDVLQRTLLFAHEIGADEAVLIGVPMDGLKESPVRVRLATLDAPLG